MSMGDKKKQLSLRSAAPIWLRTFGQSDISPESFLTNTGANVIKLFTYIIY